MQNLYLLDAKRGPVPALLLMAAALAQPDSDVLLLDGAADRDVARRAQERFQPQWVGGMPGLGAENDLPGAMPDVLAYLAALRLPDARGVVLAPEHSPSWMVKGAALATRLGYLLWPLEEVAGLTQVAAPNLELIVVGEAPGLLAQQLAGRAWHHLAGDRALAAFLQERAPVDNLVLINTADLHPPGYSAEGLAGHWTPGLSLLAPQLAAYRSALVLDAKSPRPDGRAIEATVAQKLADTGLQPAYFTILASPGAVPYITDTNPAFAGALEHYVRDLHLRHDDDLLADVAEGRIYASSLGRASFNLLTVRRWDLVQGSFRQRASIIASPHVTGLVRFAADEAIARTQLTPVWERLGLKVTELYDRQAAPAQISARLTDSVLTLYAGQGNPASWRTHDHAFTAQDLPDSLAPGIVYACADSTASPHGFLESDDGGVSHQAIRPADPFATIGPAIVDRGALAYVGGLTAEDVLLNSPMYVAFWQALLLKGLTVGQAALAARNYALTWAGLLAQAAPDRADDYRLVLSRTIGQQALLGDPAFAPFPAGSLKAATPVRSQPEVTAAAGHLTVRVSVPAENWQRISLPVDDSPWSRRFHRARLHEAWLPMLEDVYPWADHYPIAPGPNGEASQGLMGGWVHVSAALPPGEVPLALTLSDAWAGQASCLPCGAGEDGAGQLATAAFRRFTVPLGEELAPAVFDFRAGWPFVTEETAAGLVVHWLVPTVAIDGDTQQAAPLLQAGFTLRHTPGVRVEGRLQATTPLPADLLVSVGIMDATAAPDAVAPDAAAPDAAAAPGFRALTQVLAQPGGRFVAHVPATGALAVRVQSPLPAYQHALAGCLGLPAAPVTGLQPVDGVLTVPLTLHGSGLLRGVVIDATSGEPLDGAVVRLWQGAALNAAGLQGNMGLAGTVGLQAYVAEAVSDHGGRFEFTAPAGTYTVAVAARFDLRYLPAGQVITLHPGQTTFSVVGMQPGALLTGRVTFGGGVPPLRGRVHILALGAERIIATGFVLPDGTLRAMVPAGHPFAVRCWIEGFVPLLDDNRGQGYAIAPGGELARTYQLETAPAD